jgi:phosphoribosylanthranilate isomerase
MRLFESGRVGVKICGITSEADARMCIREGADALGFNFYAPSKRYVDPAHALDWIHKLEGLIDRIAVVVNPSPDLLTTLIQSGGFEMIQFHGDESPSDCSTSRASNWMKAIRARDKETLRAALEFPCPALLLDAWSPVAYGGTGEVADWNLVRQFVKEHPERKCILAGGLQPQNVSQAVASIKPAAVDVAGGVESGPGIKCPELTRAFIQAVRRADA